MAVPGGYWVRPAVMAWTARQAAAARAGWPTGRAARPVRSSYQQIAQAAVVVAGSVPAGRPVRTVAQAGPGSGRRAAVVAAADTRSSRAPLAAQVVRGRAPR